MTIETFALKKEKTCVEVFLGGLYYTESLNETGDACKRINATSALQKRNNDIKGRHRIISV